MKPISGLIALLFPQAPLIHVIRHPLDTILSVFSNSLTHGFHCAFALESAARITASSWNSSSNYRSELTLRYLPVRYEDIVDDQENERSPHARFHRRAVRRACLEFPRKPPLCSHRQLRPGD